jgi:drug/metabolite transporter (DMT)-like permease
VPSPVQIRTSHLTLAWTLLLTLALVWGSSFILIKKGLAVYSPLQVGTLRIFAAGIFCLFFAAFRWREIPFSRWKLAVISGLLGNLLPSLLFSLAGTHLSSSVSGILNAFTPLATLIIGWFFFSRRVSGAKALGIVLGLLGCIWLVLVNAKGSIEFNGYAFLPILAALFYGINLNFYKNYLSDISPVSLAMLAIGLVSVPAGIMLFSTDFVAVTQANPASGQAIGFVLLLAFFGSVCGTVLSNKLNQIVSPLLASSVTYLIPVVAIGWGLLDGEDLGLSQILGMLIIILGILVVNRAK